MPSTQIDVRREYPRADEIAIMDAVHGALVAAFRIPAGDRNVRLVAHEPHRFACHPRLEQPERFTLVTIDCIAGRSADAKRQLYAEIVERLAPFGIPADHVTVTLREAPLENWGIRGGNAASDIDLGFDVEV